MTTILVAVGLAAGAFLFYKFVLPTIIAAVTPPRRMAQMILRNELRKLSVGPAAVDDAALAEIAEFVVSCAKGANLGGRETFHEALYKMNATLPRQIKAFVVSEDWTNEQSPLFDMLRRAGVKQIKRSRYLLEILGELMELRPAAMMGTARLRGSKQEVKEAIKDAWKQYPEKRRALAHAYVHLSHFQDGIGEEVLDCEMPGGDAPQDVESARREIAEFLSGPKGRRNDEWIAWSKVAMAEAEILAQEFEEFERATTA
ncbi:MAG: hypothetical protein AB7H77_08290 [Bdellovibrionales bacterium]